MHLLISNPLTIASLIDIVTKKVLIFYKLLRYECFAANQIETFENTTNLIGALHHLKTGVNLY